MIQKEQHTKVTREMIEAATDVSILREYKLGLIEAKVAIETQLDEERMYFKQTGEHSDANWYRRATGALRIIAARLSRCNTRITSINRERKKSELETFREVVRILPSGR